MVLAEVFSDFGHHIHPERFRVLYPIDDKVCPLFGTDLGYEGMEHLFDNEDLVVDLREDTNHPIHLGITDVLNVLRKTPRYDLYKTVLRATHPMLSLGKRI